MPNLPTDQALHNIRLCALVSLVANLVALEAQFRVTFKWVMSALAAEDAVRTRPFIRTLLGHVPKLLAVAALYRWIWLNIVPCHLILELREHVLSFITRVSWLFVICLGSYDAQICFIGSLSKCMWTFYVIGLLVLSCWIHMPSKVHVTFYSSTRDDQVWVTLCVDSTYVVVQLLRTNRLLMLLHNLLLWNVTAIIFKEGAGGAKIACSPILDKLLIQCRALHRCDTALQDRLVPWWLLDLCLTYLRG